MKNLDKTLELLDDNSNFSEFFEQNSEKLNTIYYADRIVNKYPSIFFDKWLEHAGVTQKITNAIVNNIVNDNSSDMSQKFTYLLMHLIENNFYNKKNVIHLENLLLKNNLRYLVIYLRLYLKEKQQPITSKNLNFLIGLKTVGIIDDHIENQILTLTLEKTESIVDLFEFTVSKLVKTNELNYQLNLMSKINPNVFDLIVDSNIIDIKKNNKLLQKILTCSAINQNIDLYFHLLNNYNMIPSKTDILSAFGLTLTKKKRIVTKVKGYRGRYRYRYISPSTRFNHNFHFDKTKYNLEHENKLVKLVKYYTNHNINLNVIPHIKNYICHLLSLGYLELQLEICNNIGYKHGGHTLHSLITKIVHIDNDVLLKKCIEYSQISTEKFVNSTWLTKSVKNECYKISQYMIDTLKMKTTGKDVIRGSRNYKKLLFLHKNKLPIQESCISTLFINNDLKAIDFCVETLKYKVTWNSLLNLFKCSQTTSAITIFKKYYPALEVKQPLKIVSSILNNKITIHTLAMIKFVLKGITLKNNSSILLKALQTKNLQIVKYFCETHGFTIDHMTNEMFETCMSVSYRNVYRRRSMRRLTDDTYHETKNLNVFEYLQNKFPVKFMEFSSNIIENKREILFDIAKQYFYNNSNHEKLCIFVKQMKDLFNWQCSLEELKIWIKDIYRNSDMENVLNCYNFDKHDMKKFLQSIQFWKFPNLFFIICKKHDIDIKEYINPETMTSMFVRGDLNASQFTQYFENINTNVTPYAYSLITKIWSRQRVSSRYIKIVSDKIQTINKFCKDIKEVDYEKLKKYDIKSYKFNIVEYNLTQNENNELNKNLYENYYEDNYEDDYQNINENYVENYENYEYDENPNYINEAIVHL